MVKKYKIDKLLIFYIILFFIISITSIYSASMYLSPTLGNLPLKQILWYVAGALIIYFIMKKGNKFFYKYAWYIYLTNIVLLFGLLFFAPSINGSKCWYIINGIGSFQPSEFMKISLILMLASTINYFHKRKRKPSLKDEFILILEVIIITLIPSILTFLEPDTGAVIIYLIISLFMLFISGIKIFWFILFGTIILLLGGSFL